MKDKEFLQWLYSRLADLYEENPNTDYMHILKSIIDNYDEDKITPSVINGSTN